MALLNIQIPIKLGDVVNVVSKFTDGKVGHYLKEIQKPTMELLGLYGLQVSTIESSSF